MALSQSTFSIYKCYIVNYIVKLVTHAAAAFSGCMCEIHQDYIQRNAISLIMIMNWYHQHSLDVSKILLYSSQSFCLISAVGAVVSLNCREKLFLVVKNQMAHRKLKTRLKWTVELTNFLLLSIYVVFTCFCIYVVYCLNLKFSDY